MIHILGSNGMLGSYVHRFLSDKYPCVGHTRGSFDVLKDIENIDKLQIKTGDTVVNCIGVIKPRIEAVGETNSFIINSLFPRLLADYCQTERATLIHVTTDCVYSGKEGSYDESDNADQLDTYGLSKKLGEANNCCVIRTSIIGEEKHNKRSLIEWAKSQKGGEVFGFTNHYWNGITCLEFAKCVHKLIESQYHWNGVWHVFTPDRYTKLQMLQMFDEIFDLNLSIEPKEADSCCDRSLASIYPASSWLTIPPLKQQIEEMKAFGY